MYIFVIKWLVFFWDMDKVYKQQTTKNASLYSGISMSDGL